MPAAKDEPAGPAAKDDAPPAPDPTDTEHPTGDQQAADNTAEEPPG